MEPSTECAEGKQIVHHALSHSSSIEEERGPVAFFVVNY